MNKISKIFRPVLITPKNAIIKNVDITSRSQKLMTELGLIKATGNGTYQIMPLAQRSIDKCIELVHQHMQSIDGQKIALPVLTAASLWKKSGRLDGDITEFYMLKDRHGKEFLLSPTHEEAITSMLATISPISYRQLPLRLYQVGPKFRDELKARFGLIRAKEFCMKDLYSFDQTPAEALSSYNLITDAYDSLLKQLEVPFVKVEAHTGIMGGSISHEFHYLADTGENRILRCIDCNYAVNREINETVIIQCPHCQSHALTEVRGIEVAHTFLLGDKYSRPLNATVLCEDGKPTPLQMGCYGIGITRLVAAALEALSTENDLCWPSLLAPFEVCVIGPKLGSKTQSIGDVLEHEICKSLSEICGADEVVQDDRKNLTIGKRLMEAKRMGYPFIVVIGGKVSQETPKLELHIGERIFELLPNEIIHEILKCKKTRKNALYQNKIKCENL